MIKMYFKFVVYVFRCFWNQIIILQREWTLLWVRSSLSLKLTLLQLAGKPCTCSCKPMSLLRLTTYKSKNKYIRYYSNLGWKQWVKTLFVFERGCFMFRLRASTCVSCHRWVGGGRCARLWGVITVSQTHLGSFLKPVNLHSPLWMELETPRKNKWISGDCSRKYYIVFVINDSGKFTTGGNIYMGPSPKS